MARPHAQEPPTRPDREATLFSVAKAHWRFFAPAWIFPVFVFYGSSWADGAHLGPLFFWGCVVPLFYWALFRALMPHTKKVAPYRPVVFWAIGAPFLVWAATVFLSLMFGQAR